MLASPAFLPDAIKVEGCYPQALFYLYPESVDVLYALLKEQGHEVGELTVWGYG